MIEPDAQIVISVEFVEFGSLLAVVQSLKLDQARTSLVGDWSTDNPRTTSGIASQYNGCLHIDKILRGTIGLRSIIKIPETNSKTAAGNKIDCSFRLVAWNGSRLHVHKCGQRTVHNCTRRFLVPPQRRAPNHPVVANNSYHGRIWVSHSLRVGRRRGILLKK